MVRAIVGFVVAAVVWMPAFFVLASLGNFVWPDYGIHGEAWFERGTYTFVSLMSVFHVLCWVLVDALVGWLAVALGRRRQVAWALAAAIGSYACLMHLVLYWPTFPCWYNVAVAVLAAPAVLVGGKLAGSLVRSSPAAMAH